MKFVIIIAIAVVLLIPTTAYGAEGYFESHYGRTMSQSPTVCIFEPNDYRITEQRWNIWYPEMRAAIMTWDAILKGNTGAGGSWDITIVEVPLEKLDLLNYSACDIRVFFTDEQYPGGGFAFGWASPYTGSISIHFPLSETCGTEYSERQGIMINKYCNVEGVFSVRSMASTLQHEIGHTFGLPHFTSDNYKLRQEWYDVKGAGTPSIMTSHPPNVDLHKITGIDVELLRQIYDTGGFGKKTTSISVFNERIILEPVIPVSTNVEFILKEGSIEYVDISGRIPNELYKRGVVLEIVIQKPDGTVEYEATSVAKTYKAYKYSLVFDYTSSQVGKYEIALKFNGEIFDKMIVYIEKEEKSRLEIHLENVEKLQKAKLEREQNLLQKEIIESELRMNVLDTELNSLKDRTEKTQNKLDNTYNTIRDAENKYTSEKSKIYLAKAWDIYNDVSKEFEKSKKWADEYDSKVEDLKSKPIEEQKVYYDDLVPEMKNFKGSTFWKLDKKLLNISEELDNAEKPKLTCFLLWCW